MRADLTQEGLAEVLGETLETAAFMAIDPFADPPPWEGPVLRAEMTFDGPERGTVALAASPQLAVELTANLLGLEPDGEEARAKLRDGLGEILNMLVGVFVVRAFGEDAPCRIGLPKVTEVDAAAQDAAMAKAAPALSTVVDDTHRVDLGVHPVAREGGQR